MAGKGGGGAWKVAYADFVTAMMALFLVLWITSQDKKVKEAIELTFKHPFMKGPRQSSGIIPNTIERLSGKSFEGQYQTPSPLEIDMLRHLNEDLLKVLGTNPDYERVQSVKLDFTPQGLNISVLNRGQKPIFEPNTATFTEYGTWLFSTLAWEISRYKRFLVDLEGHAEQGHEAVSDNHDIWDLTAERANAARRLLVHNGVSNDQIRRVSGFGDKVPMPETDPTDEINNRVAVLLAVKEGAEFQAKND